MPHAAGDACIDACSSDLARFGDTGGASCGNTLIVLHDIVECQADEVAPEAKNKNKESRGSCGDAIQLKERTLIWDVVSTHTLT